MISSNRLDDALKQAWNQVLNFLDLANFKYFLQLGQEKSFLDAVGEGPELEKALE